MANKKNRFNFESEAQRTKHINEIIAYFQDDRNQDIGYIAAAELLDFFLQNMGEDIYKVAIKDCQKLLSQKFEDIEVELDVLTPKSK